jgi:hypothetical protein
MHCSISSDSLRNINLLNQNSQIKALSVQIDKINDVFIYNKVGNLKHVIIKRDVLSNIVQLYKSL